MTFSNKSCELDPLLTWLLKQYTEELLPLISTIINDSLESGIFLSQSKHAIVRPLLKKQGLDANGLKNYRPNQQFISKVLEKVVDQRINELLITDSLRGFCNLKCSIFYFFNIKIFLQFKVKICAYTQLKSKNLKKNSQGGFATPPNVPKLGVSGVKDTAKTYKV